MLTAEKVKEVVRACGADLVGIASMDRFEGSPKQMDPRYIFPDAKVMIVFGFRILRGTLRGIEEGTYFSAYSSMGYASINVLRQPMVTWEFATFLEDNGYEAVPIRTFWGATDISGVQGADVNTPRENWSRPVAPDKPYPDVSVNMRIAAFCAGLGEIGYSKLLLTPQFGPRQRFGAVITDAPLEPDPLYDGPQLCDRCMACVRGCSGKAISPHKTTKITVAGREIEFGEFDAPKCSLAFCGGTKETNPFMVTKEDEEGFNKPPYWNAQNYKVAPINGYGRALEGASGCIRACMVHLESQGKLENKFASPFRRSKPWKLS